MSQRLESSIEKMIDDFGLGPGVENLAKSLLDEMFENDMQYKYSAYGGYNTMVLCAVYTAARQNRVPLDAEVVISYAREEDCFELTKTFSASKLRRLRSGMVRKLGMDTVMLEPSDYISFCKECFEMSDESWRMLDKLVDEVERSDRNVNRSAKTLTSGAIYVVAVLNDESLPQSTIRRALNVSRPSIVNSYRDILKALTDLDVDDYALHNIHVTPTTLGINLD